MNEKYLEGLAQYDRMTDSVRKGRSGWICETDRGTALLQEYRGTLRRLEFEDLVLSRVEEDGQIPVDQYIKTKEDSLIALGADGTRYVLKEWFTDRECSLKDHKEVLLAVRQIARLHKCLAKIPRSEEWNLGSIHGESLEQEMKRHNREMTRTRNYIKQKKKKTDFERCVMETFPAFFECAQEAEAGMAALKEKEHEDRLCHGNMDHHHILMGEGYTAVIEFHKMHLGDQMEDLYHFVRKTMEKHNWDIRLGQEMFAAYDRIMPLSMEKIESLYYLFLYPEKYWKQLNFYYNSKKAWFPARNMEKIRILMEQAENQKNFLELLQ